MRLLHTLAKTHASFDDPNLVSHASLVPVMALAQRAGLADLVAEHVRAGGDCGQRGPEGGVPGGHGNAGSPARPGRNLTSRAGDRRGLVRG